MDPDGLGDPARPEDRRRGRVVAWAPGLDDATAGGWAGGSGGSGGEATEDGEDAPRRRPDTLGELDFVITPVSVTPPPTWRRAAWFAVGASCVVLTVLVFAAVRLAGGSLERIDAFPGLPTGGLLTADPVGPPAHLPARTTLMPGQSAAALPRGQAGSTPATAPGAGGPLRGGPGEPGPATVTTAAGPTDDGPTGANVPEPSVSVLATTGSPSPVSASELIAGTRQFFDQLPTNIDGAWAMVGPPVRQQGYDAFRRQWDVAELHLQQMVVDADDSSVVATVRTIAYGGRNSVQRYLLAFDKAATLVVESITPVNGGGHKPVK